MAQKFGQYTHAFVAAALAVAGGAAIYYSLPFKWLLVALPFALWEAWTLVNKQPHDTISETIWRFNRTMPLVPHLIGVFVGWLIGSGQLGFVDYGLGVLCGHFVFSRTCVVTPEDLSSLGLSKRDAAAALRQRAQQPPSPESQKLPSSFGGLCD